MNELRGLLAITGRGWCDFLRDEPDLEEVNFWKPSSRREVRAEPFTPWTDTHIPSPLRKR